jgi:hypothetical protein
VRSVGKIKYQPINTNWFYSYITIPQLADIQLELISLLSLPVPKKQFTSYYTNIYVPNIIQCPCLMDYLNLVGIKSKLLRVLYSSSNGPGLNYAPPHVDSVNPETSFRYSLNIPLVDAEDSYTVWYEQTKESKILFDTTTYTGWVENKNEVREIARVQYTQPMILNTSILHGGKINSNRRMIAGLRFWPELTQEEVDRLISLKDSNTL